MTADKPSGVERCGGCPHPYHFPLRCGVGRTETGDDGCQCVAASRQTRIRATRLVPPKPAGEYDSNAELDHLAGAAPSATEEPRCDACDVDGNRCTKPEGHDAGHTIRGTESPAPSVPGPQSASQIGPPALTAEEWRQIEATAESPSVNPKSVVALARFALAARPILEHYAVPHKHTQETLDRFGPAVEWCWSCRARALAAPREEEEGK